MLHEFDPMPLSHEAVFSHGASFMDVTPCWRGDVLERLERLAADDGDEAEEEGEPNPMFDRMVWSVTVQDLDPEAYRLDRELVQVVVYSDLPPAAPPAWTRGSPGFAAFMPVEFVGLRACLYVDRSRCESAEHRRGGRSRGGKRRPRCQSRLAWILMADAMYPLGAAPTPLPGAEPFRFAKRLRIEVMPPPDADPDPDFDPESDEEWEAEPASQS
jgi:hypothetical protein